MGTSVLGLSTSQDGNVTTLIPLKVLVFLYSWNKTFDIQRPPDAPIEYIRALLSTAFEFGLFLIPSDSEKTQHDVLSTSVDVLSGKEEMTKSDYEEFERSAVQFAKSHRKYLDLSRCLVISNRYGWLKCVEYLQTEEEMEREKEREREGDANAELRRIQRAIETKASPAPTLLSQLSSRLPFSLSLLLRSLPNLFKLSPSVTAEFCVDKFPLILPHNVYSSLSLPSLHSLLWEKGEVKEEEGRVCVGYFSLLFSRHPRSACVCEWVHYAFAIAVSFGPKKKGTL